MINGFETRSYGFGDVIRGVFKLCPTPVCVNIPGAMGNNVDGLIHQIKELEASLICSQKTRAPEMERADKIFSRSWNGGLKDNLDFEFQVPYEGYPHTTRRPNLEVTWMLKFKFTVEST